MAANEIKILISGDAQGVQKAATRATASMDALQKSATQTAATLAKSTVGTNQAAFALTNLSRVAQDAPFGFIGIQNNLNPLLESFGRLKQETGSSASAFRALAASLAGPAGIGLALGVVSGLITVAVQKYGSLGGAIEALFSSQSGLVRANQELRDSFAEAAGSAASETAVINSLVTVARNETLSKEARLEAVNKLNKEYDEFLPKLTLENINTQAVTDSVNKLNEALLRQAKIKGVQDLIAKEFERLTKVLSDPEESIGFFDKLGSAISGMGSVSKAATDLAITGVKNQASAADEARKRIEVFNKVLLDLLTAEATEGTLFTETQKKGVDALKARLAELEKIKKVTKDITALTDLEEQIFDLKVKITLRDAAKNGLSKEEADLAIRGFRDQLTEAFNREVLAFEAIPKVKVTDVELVPLDSGVIESKIAKAVGLDKTIPIKSDRQVKIELLGLEFVLAQEEAQKAVEKLRETIVNGAVDALASASTAFGEAISGIFSGGIGNALAKGAQTLLSGIGGVLQEIGKQIIATSTLIKALKEALKSLIANPVAGIAIGVGLVTLGGLLKNIKIPGFASGVNNFSGGLAIVGERGPELVNLPRGSDVIPNHMLNGGQQPIILQPSVRFAGKDMYVMLQRVTESNKTVGGGTL